MTFPFQRIFSAAILMSMSAHAQIVPGFDQRYVGASFNEGTDVWTATVGPNATANNATAFTATTTPNGSAAVQNATAAAFMNFTRSTTLGNTGRFTIQAVVRVDGSVAGTLDDRSGPFALAQTNGWGGLFMGIQADGINDVRGGNVGASGANTTVLAFDNGGAPITSSIWGVYTMVVDATQNTNPQMTVSFAKLSDLSTTFTLTDTANNIATTTTSLALGNAGVLFGGERGGTTTNNTTGGWNGAIADLVVYNTALSVSDINSNLVEFQSLYHAETRFNEGLKSGLLSYWTFDNDLTDSAHGESGTNSATNDLGSWVGNSAFGTGRIGRGLVLNGSQHVSIPDSADLDRTDSDLTISTWMRVDNWNTGWQALLAKGEAQAFRLARQGDSTASLAYSGGTGDIFGGAVNDGAWHHVVATTEEGAGVSLWIDGVKVANGTGPASLTNTGNGSVGPFLIGANPQITTLRRWIGAIDEVAIWDRVLTSAEIGHLATGNLLFADPFLLAGAQLSGAPFNGGAVQRSVPISNDGESETLTITSVTLGGADASRFTVNSFPTSLLPGQTGNIILTFTPLAIESYEATLNIASNSQGNSNEIVDIRIDGLPDLVNGISFRVYQADRSLTEMPILGNDQSPNVDELRTTIDYKDTDKNGVADAGSNGNFGTVPPLARLENLYCEAFGYLQITNAGNYTFRLTADDGAEFFVNNNLVIDNSQFQRSSEAALASDPVNIGTGVFPFKVKFWTGTGSPSLKLEWLKPGSSTWETVPAYASGSANDGAVTENVTRVVSEGQKLVYYPGQASGQLDQVHPAYDLFTFAGDYGRAYPGENRPSPPNLTISGTTDAFRPQVGAMDFLPDGRLLVASFQPPGPASAVPADNTLNHKIYSVSGALGGDLNSVVVKEVANGLSNPTGMCVVGSDVYVAEIHKIVRLRDNNSDGDFLDAGEETEVAGGNEAWDTNNYHHFTFGLIHDDGYLYGTLSTSIVFSGGSAQGLNGPNPANRGTWFRVNIATGDVDFLAGGLRTPNGIGFGPEGKIFGTDNQGSWNPANNLYEYTADHFYGHYNWPTGGVESAFWNSPVHWDASETPVYATNYQSGKRRFTRPAIYLPHGELSNSPTQPLLIGDQHPSFKGQMYVAELTLGGIRRVFLEKINGRFQGAAFQFSQGMVAGNNRMVWGPDDALYVGGMGPGDSGNWSWRGTWYGLQRLSPNGSEVFEIQTMRAVQGGFIVTFTKPVAAATLSNLNNYGTVDQWTYNNQSYSYGAGRTNLADLSITQASPLADGKSVRLTIPGLAAETVVKLQLARALTSSSGEPLWSGEAFYTLNAIPNELESTWAEWVTQHFPGVADLDVIGQGANPDNDVYDNYTEFVRGGDPKIQDVLTNVKIASVGTKFELTVRQRDPIPSPAIVRWESSTDLESWDEVTQGMLRIGATPVNGDISEVKFEFSPPANSPRLFFRRTWEKPE